MKRKIIDIDEGKCTGCGRCLPGCPEGALRCSASWGLRTPHLSPGGNSASTDPEPGEGGGEVQ